MARHRTVSVTEAARNFSDLINRVFYRGERVVLERGGREVAHLTPPPRAGRLGDLPALLDAVPKLSEEEAAAFAEALEAARRDLPPLPDEDPWPS